MVWKSSSTPTYRKGEVKRPFNCYRDTLILSVYIHSLCMVESMYVYLHMQAHMWGCSSVSLFHSVGGGGGARACELVHASTCMHAHTQTSATFLGHSALYLSKKEVSLGEPR